MVINVNTPTKTNIPLGIQDENGVTTIEFDTYEWEALYGSGELRAVVKRHGDDEPYPINIENNIWEVSSVDTAKKGRGQLQLSWVVEGVVKKSVIHDTIVLPSLTTTTVEPPDPYETWLDEMRSIDTEVMESADNVAGLATLANDEALKAEGYAVGKQNGNDVSSGTYYQNNAKYYSNQASISATSASASATTATAAASTFTKAVWVDMGTITELPVTKTAVGVTTDMVCAEYILGTPTAQSSDWVVNTDTPDSITISGTMRGSGGTTLKMLLVAKNDITVE